jgi:hypothetical protein
MPPGAIAASGSRPTPRAETNGKLLIAIAFHSQLQHAALVSGSTRHYTCGIEGTRAPAPASPTALILFGIQPIGTS